MSSYPQQGEIWWVTFDPTAGNEQAGTRPALVVSRDELNRTGLCMVLPGTTREKPRPGRVKVPSGHAGLVSDTWFLCDQLRTVSGVRFLRLAGFADRKYLLQALTQTHFFLRPPD